jgi:hypothetical protein
MRERKSLNCVHRQTFVGCIVVQNPFADGEWHQTICINFIASFGRDEVKIKANSRGRESPKCRRTSACGRFAPRLPNACVQKHSLATSREGMDLSGGGSLRPRAPKAMSEELRHRE